MTSLEKLKNDVLITVVESLHFKDLVTFKARIESGEPGRQLTFDVYGGERRTLLHIACCLGNYAVATILLNNGALIDALDVNKCTPMHLAALHGHVKLVNLLLGQGSVAYRNNLVTKHGDTVLHYAVCSNSIACLKAFSVFNTPLQPLYYNASGATPMHYALRARFYDAVAELLRINGNFIEVCPIHHIVYECTSTILGAVLNDAVGVDIDTRDIGGWTPMHLAAMVNNYNMMEVLLDHGSKALSFGHTISGYTPLHCLAHGGHTKSLRYFLDRYPEHIFNVNAKGQTLLHVAIEAKQETASLFLIDTYPALIPLKDGRAFSTLQCAIFSNVPAILGALVLRNRDLIQAISRV